MPDQLGVLAPSEAPSAPEASVDPPASCAPPALALSAHRVRLVTAGVVLSSFLAALEATVVSTAMPTIIGALGGMEVYAWVFTAYMLTLTVSGPLWGRLSDIVGRRPVCLGSILLFLVGSGASGAVGSIEALIFWRAVQGLGAGGLTPIGQTILAEIYSVADRARVQGMVTAVFGVASLAGPAVGGWLCQHASWRWVFYVNLPFGLCSVALLAATLPREAPSGAARRIDWTGAALLSIGLVCLLLVLDLGVAWGYTSARVLAGSALAVAALAAFVRVEQRTADALVPLGLVAVPGVAGACGVMLMLGMMLFSAVTFVPLYCQEVLGFTPFEAGRVLTPLMLGWSVFATVGARLMLRSGVRPLALAGVVATGSGFAVLATLGAHGASSWILACAASLLGAGAGLCMPPLVIGVQNQVARSELGIATSLVLLTRSVGAALGVTLCGALVGSGSGAALAPGLHQAFVAGCIFALVAAAAALTLPRR